MGKSSKKAAAAVAAPAAVPKGKPGKKRDAEDEIEKAVSAKKQKAAPPKEDVKKAKKQPPPKKVESSSSEEEESESEEEVKVQTKKAAKPVKQESSDDSSDETSESDEEPTKNPAASKQPFPVAKAKQESSSSESSSEDESDDDDKPAVTGAQKKKEEFESSDSDSDDESDEEVAPKSKAPVAASKKEDSSESESERDSEDEDKTAKAAQPAKKPASAAASKRKDESSDSSDSDESDEEPPQKKQKDTAPSAAVKSASAAKTESSSDDEDDSDEESSDDEPKTNQPKKAPKASASSGSDEEESDEDSDEEDEEPAKTPKKDAAAARISEKQNAAKEPKTPMGTQSEETGSKTLFMGNIPFSADFDIVKEFFQEAGEVVDVRFATNEDGSLRGFGHVEFASAEAAKKALEYNGQELMGRSLRLDLARERGAYTPRSGNDNGSFQKPARGSSQSVFIRGFDKSLAEDKIRSSLEQHFADCGEITRVSVPMDYDTGASKGIAYVDFKDQDSLQKALGLNGSDLGGWELYVDEAKPRGDNRGGGGRSGGRFGDRSGGRSGGWRGGGRSGRFGGRDGGGGRFGRRASWRIVSSIEQKEEGRGAAGHAAAARGYRGRVENELSNICAGILRLLDERLVPAAVAVDAKVFYLKMKGDYHRYLAEFKTGNERKDAADATLSAYQAAQDIAMKELPPTHPIRLGLALNFSVFYYEILNSPDRACSLAKQAFDEAISELDTLGEESYKDSTLIMQLLRDNLTLWTSDMQDDGGDEMRDASKPEDEQ